MKIGYCVEGATDRAFLAGLKQRWCPHADLQEGRFRGSTGDSLTRELPRICCELSTKSCDAIVFLTDANKRKWREIRKEQRQRVPQEYQHLTIIGIPDPKIESWICADGSWISGKLGIDPVHLKSGDPKSVFESALSISSRDRKETEIADLVRDAPLKSWISKAPSFKAFYEEVLNFCKTIGGCQIPNEC